MAERAARAIGLDICGIDLLATDITLPLKASGATVIEVNAGPGFRMHTHPTEGKPRDVGRCFADRLFPGDEGGRIPILAVAGTNGKTTTTRLLAHLMKTAGHRVGFTTIEGIYIDGFQVEEGDCTGPISNRKVLMDASVEVVVLECARGGMLRSGLAFDQCDVGIVTNVAADHLGLRDIHTADDMAQVSVPAPPWGARANMGNGFFRENETRCCQSRARWVTPPPAPPPQMHRSPRAWAKWPAFFPKRLSKTCSSETPK